MPTIAELQVNVNTKQIDDAKSAFEGFRTAAENAKNAANGFSQSGNSGHARSETKDVKDLSSAIDLQTRKLKELTEQRNKLEASGMKSTMPQEYERLNRIIDSNISLVNRQGNAISQLSAAQDRDAKKREDQEKRVESARQRAERAVIRQENVITNANAKQQREVDRVINGLSRQIKAQNDYNDAVEKLNRARALSGMGGPNTNTMSAAEYDSYVKLAAAQRDSALAAQDNSRAVERAQTKLEGYVGKLSAAERAQLEFARASRSASDALNLGVINQDQYNQRMQQFAEKRDKSIASVNSNAAAEEKFARQLRQVSSEYDPVLKATQQYDNALTILNQGLQKGAISSDEYKRALQQQKQALDDVKAKAASSGPNIGKEYEDALRSVLPYRTELANLAKQQEALDNAKRAGHVTTQQQIKDYDTATKAISQQTEFYKKRIAAANENTISAKQEAAAMRGLPAQFSDIVVSLQGGQAPLTVFLQQGAQIKDMFGGAGNAVKAMGSYVLGLVTPLTAVAALMGVLAAGAYAGRGEIEAFNKAIIKSGQYSGVSANQFSQYREEVSQLNGTSAGVVDALTAMQSSGKITGEVFVEVASAAARLKEAGEGTISEIVDEFASLGKDPVQAAIRLDEKYKFLTSSVLAQADALVRQGKEQEATILLQRELADNSGNMADKLIENLGYVETAWLKVKNAVTDTWNAVKAIGRDSTQDELNNLNSEKQKLEERSRGYTFGGELRPETDASRSILKNDPRYQEILNEIKNKTLRKNYEDYMASISSAQEKARKIQNNITAENISSYTSNLGQINAVAAAEEKVTQVKLRGQKLVDAAKERGVELTADEIKYQKAALDAAEASLTKAKEAEARSKKPKTTPLNNNDVNLERSNLRKIEAEYDRYYKNVTALGKAGIVSQEATFASQKALLEAERKAVEESYNSQIDEIKKLQGSKKNNASQNIQLQNQLIKAEEQRQVALEKIDSKEEQRAAAEKARTDQRINSLREYKAALQSSLDALEEKGGRDAAAVGRGSRQASLNQSLYDEDNSYNRARRSLSRSLSENKIDPEEYKERLDALTENHTLMSNKIIENDKRVQEAQRDWKNGFTSALENAEDSARNVAGLVDDALSGAFNRAGEALAQFVTTGKLNFKSFATSVIADMAAMAAKQAAMGALSGLLRIGVTAASAYFGGGAGTTTGVTGGSSFGQLGASYSGTGVFANSHGGVYNQGTKYFAKGGAFTNSVVSSSTDFGMSGGGRGVMGEAGPEAIVPLARTRDGNLGVRMMGGEGGNMAAVEVNVYVTESGQQTNTTGDGGDQYKGMGDKIGQLVRQEVYTIINKETRPGGSLKSQ